MRSTVRRLLSLVCVASLPWLATPTAAGPESEDAQLQKRVEAAVLLNFARFVTWPSGRFESPTSPIEICVVGDADFGTVVMETVRGKSVLDHPLQVSTLPMNAPALQRCHIAHFPAEVSEADLDRMLGQLRGRAVFSVHEGDAARGDAVARLYLDNRRVQFEINAAAAEREQLRVSAKLLGVARVVDR